MRLPILLVALAAMTACSPPAQVTKSRPQTEVGVGFGQPSLVSASGASRAGTGFARDFMELSFALESGRQLDLFTRIEGPITVGLAGHVPPTAPADLRSLIGRLQGEAGLDISYLANGTPTITVEFATRSELRRLAPSAACFVVPNVTSLAEYRKRRGSAVVDWAQITSRDSAAIFIPADTSPQEIRDCLHEELAQALGPLNDLYRLPDSVFNDDNFHSVLTSFDMAVLRTYHAPALQNGMSRDEVGMRLPMALAGVNAGGLGSGSGGPTPAAWIDAIEAALGRQGSVGARKASAEQALAFAVAQGWQDSRMAFSHFAVARLSAGSDKSRAVAEFATAAAIYSRLPGGEVQVAHVEMQLAAIALSAGQPEEAMMLADRAIPVVRQHGNAALLATLMLIKAEALDRLGQPSAAAALRLDSQSWARYGFGPDSVVKARMRDIAAVADRAANG